MPSVSVMINGKAYRMACDEGQEQHLLGLGERLNEAIDDLRAAFGEIGDQRLIVMAAITMADRAAESARRLAEAKSQLSELRNEASKSPARERQVEEEVARAVNEAAERVTEIARRLNASD